MSVKYALLGLLEREPSHGYQLKQSYDELFGREKPLQYGQIYSTLGRLARDGLIEAGGFERGSGPDRKRYEITLEGASDLDKWIIAPEPPAPHLQTVFFIKVVLALMLNRNADEFLDAQRASHLARMREITRLRREGGLAESLLADYSIFHLEADLRWIDLTAARLDALAKEVHK